MSLNSQIRRKIIQKRNTLTAEHIQQSSQRACERLMALPVYQQAQNIACYQVIQGEIDPCYLVPQAFCQHKKLFFPKSDLASKQLSFLPVQENTPFLKNKWGILEPDVALEQAIAPQCLDVVITPLVAFNASGARLGMGGGFYDRGFAFLQQYTRPAKTVLIGLAYDFQCNEDFTVESWDIALDWVVTSTTAKSHPIPSCPRA